MRVKQLVDAILKAENDPVPAEITRQTKVLFENIVFGLRHIAKEIQNGTKTKTNVSVSKSGTEAWIRIGRDQFYCRRDAALAQRTEQKGPLVGRVLFFYENSKWALLIYRAFVHQDGRFEVTSCIGPMRDKVDDFNAIKNGIAAVIQTNMFEGISYWPDGKEIQKMDVNELHREREEGTDFLAPEKFLE